MLVKPKIFNLCVNVAVLEEEQIEEIVSGNGRYLNALAKKVSVFGSVDCSSYIADING